jgi:hypothetical protein
MTDLLTKVKDALEEHESFWDSQGTWMGGETTPLEDLAPDMARALIAETERRERIERAAQWVLDNPVAHPENVRAVISKAMEE